MQKNDKTPDAKPCEIDKSFCTFGCEKIIEFLNSFEKNIDGVKANKDIECVHKTRVASRRLRAALPIFQLYFPDEKYEKWFKEIKKVTKLLGEARDLDVQIGFVQQYAKTVDLVEKESLDLLLKNRQKRRVRIQPSVELGLDELCASGIMNEIHDFCESKIRQQSTPLFDANQVLQKAKWEICGNLDEFLSLEEYVNQEKEIEKHHEMRIYAKNLRYTMELFSLLYKNGLKNEIEVIKSYQDILGEKHDLEVWLDFLPRYMAKMCGKKNCVGKYLEALEGFLGFISDERKQRYIKFVQLWSENKKADFFENLRHSTDAGATLIEERARQTLAEPKVKLAILSDIHANLQALEQVMHDAEERGAGLFINAGDTIGFGPNPNEVIALLCKKNVLSILGNYDLEVIEGKVNAKGEKKLAWKFARKELTKSSKNYLKSLPRDFRLEARSKKILVTHGSPESIEEHIYHDTPTEKLRTLADKADSNLIVIGHSHEQFSRQENGVCFVNPGSVGRPGDGNYQAAYAILSFEPFNVELIRLDYPVEASADELLKKGLPESFAQMLLKGVSLDTIIQEDKRKRDLPVTNCRLLVDKSRSFAKELSLDSEHHLHVTNLATQFFDGLKNLHNLAEKERCWLECAGFLHDIGLVRDVRKHNRESAKMILHDTSLPFTSNERQIVASIARYHRKGLPKNKHYNLAALDRATIQKIKVLSGILRVADALDYTHNSNVQHIHLEIGSKRIIAICRSKDASVLEEQAFNKKKDLFEKSLGRKLVLKWRQQ